ncbi:MFS transporter [Sphingomonas sp. MG17]|uniref:MFS transporter n=1 Tax=Sphingomonas tagetis TaxID=2949092 RepID=A0A9X2KNQ1_9SPHN|nr:MFS transporter [Sphingomonas tagetis]
MAPAGEPLTALPTRGQAWLSTAVIFVLTSIALADRMAISMLIGPIKAEFGLGDFKASLLIGLAFTLFYVLFLLPIGMAADRFSRRRVLAICLAVWSAATIACGFAAGFVSLFLARMIVGAGEAAIGPCSHGIIGDSFPRHALAKPLAVQGIGFQVGPAIGVAAAGAILAGGASGAFAGWPLLGELAPWRVAFVLIGLPGLLALMLIPLLHEPHRVRAAPDVGTSGEFWPFLRGNALLMTLIFVSAGVSAISLGVVTGWVPAYLQRTLGVSPMAAGAAMGSILLAAAILGQGLYSIIVDWFAGRGALDAPIRVGLLPIALSIPLGWLAFGARDTASFYPLLFVFLLCITPFNALNNTLAQQVAPPALRSRISAVMIFAISIIGFAGGPALVGWLSEYVVGEGRLGLAMQIVATSALALNLVLVIATRGPLLRFMSAQQAADQRKS